MAESKELKSLLMKVKKESGKVGLKLNIESIRLFYTSVTLKSLLRKVKEENKKAVLKLNIQKTKIIESCSITSWQIDGETVET